MPLANHGELKTAFLEWLARPDDTNIANQFDTFLALAEQRIYYGAQGALASAPLRLRNMQQRNATYAISTELTALPTRFLEFESLNLNTTPKTPLELVTPNHYSFSQYTGTTGKPKFFRIEGENIRVAPVPDTAYTALSIFYAKFDTPQASGTTSNWITQNVPALYLYALLLECMPYIGNDARAPQWYAAYQGAIEGLRTSDQASKWSGGVVRTTMQTNTAKP